MKLRFPLLIFSIAVAMLLLSACSPLTQATPQVESATLTDKVDEKTRAALNPLTAFPAAIKEAFISVKVLDAVKGTKVEAQWYYNRDNKGLLHVDNATYTFDQAGTQHVAFSLISNEGLPKGEYKVVILLDDQQAEAITFTVE